MQKWLDEILQSWRHEQAGAGKGIRCKIVDFLAANPSPADSDVHKFADDNGIAPDKLEEVIYGMLSEVIEKGKGGTPDPKELKVGIEVETEHSTCPRLAEYIARAHLKEIPDYYTRLKKMEAEAGVK